MEKQNHSSIKIIPLTAPPALTPGYLRSSSGMDLTDEQARDIIDTLNTLAGILLTVMYPKNINCIDNQCVVNLHQDISKNTCKSKAA